MPADAIVPASTAAHAADVRWRAHNIARRHRILDAALALLDRTPAGREITMDDVAREAGLAKSVVYRQFDGREDLFARMRTHLTEQFFAEVIGQLDTSRGSINELLNRTIAAIAVFMQSHQRWIELARRGPRHDDPVGVDAYSSLRQRLADRAQQILDQIALDAGADPAAFRRVAAAAATMQHGVLQDWLSDPQPTFSLDEIVSELSGLTWHLLDGAARQADLVVDPDLRVSEVVERLTAAAKSRDGQDTAEPLRSGSWSPGSAG